MKLANISLSVLALACTASAYSSDLSVQGELISSQGKLDAGKVKETNSVTGISQSSNPGKSETISAPGVGLSLQYKLTDALRLGGGLGWANYDGGKGKMDYNDFSLAANTSYDFFKLDSLAFYGLGGLSYHRVDPKDETIGGETLKRKNADLLNYDLGVGGRFELAENVSMSLAYRFSDTLAKGSIESTAALAATGVSAKSELQDVSLQKNELVASLGYSF